MRQRHIISATALTTGEQLAMCGHRFASYGDALAAGHVVGNYLAPTFAAYQRHRVTCLDCIAGHAKTDNVERLLGQPIHCEICGCVSSTVRRDEDNVARCDVCSRACGRSGCTSVPSDHHTRLCEPHHEQYLDQRDDHRRALVTADQEHAA
jgi:hypothetical protein